MPTHNLAEVLAKKRISKYELAKRMGLKYGNVFRFFQDDYDPKLSMMRRWAKALRCKIRDLYRE